MGDLRNIGDGVEGDREIGLGVAEVGGTVGAEGGSKGGWWKDRTECGVDTVGETETETLCALSGGFSASSLRIIASVDTRRTGAGGCRTLVPYTSSWCTLDIVLARSRWFVWSASRIGSNVGIGNGQSWRVATTSPMRRRCVTQRAHIIDRRRSLQSLAKSTTRGRQSLFRQSRPAFASHRTRVSFPPTYPLKFYSRFSLILNIFITSRHFPAHPHTHTPANTAPRFILLPSSPSFPLTPPSAFCIFRLPCCVTPRRLNMVLRNRA